MERLQNWQMFLLIIFPLIASNWFNDEFVQTILKALVLPVIFSCFLLTGEFLNQFANKQRFWFFRINCFYLIIITFLVYFDFNLPISIIIFLLGYCFFSIFYVIDHLAILIRIAEQKDVTNYKQQKEFLLFFFWPIGLWFLQPRINKLANKK